MRRLIPALVVMAGLACSATAQAQPNGRANGYWRNRGGDSQVAYDNGYRAGYDQGQRDVRSRDRYDYRRADRYRSGDAGYNGRYGDRDDYRRVFRDGFQAGYDAGYYGRSGGYSSRDPYGRYPNTYPGNRYPDNRYPDNRYPDSRYPNGSYPNGRYPNGGYGNGGYYNSEAADRGYREGVEKGRHDAKNRDRFDPRGEKWYREGDRGYNSRYGSREQYKAEYRRAFEQGYEQGYRDYGGVYNNRGTGGFRWPF
jgi:hypothetical protein